MENKGAGYWRIAAVDDFHGAAPNLGTSHVGGTTGGGGTGNTSSNATGNTWRPAAALGIIVEKD